jgi:hypothetical protein
VDAADIAVGIVETCQADAERRARGRSAPESHPDFDGIHCVECEDAIFLQRLKLGKVRCVSCQQDLEKRQAMRNH